MDTSDHLQESKLGDLNSPEVLEDPGRVVSLHHLQKVSYGTVGNGLGLETLVWPHDNYALAVTRKGQLEVARPQATSEFCAGRMNAAKLGASQLDFLLVDDVNEDWLEWLQLGTKSNNPQVIVWMVPSTAMEDEKTGPLCSYRRKFMRHRGYTMRTWLMCADQYGAAIRQDRVAVVYYQALETDPGGPTMPAPSQLPARSMSNMLLPTGIPRQAWKTHGKEQACEPPLQQKQYPCKVLQRVDNSPIYEREGPMPDATNVWIRSEKGVRRLQACELAKAKGLPSQWVEAGKKMTATTVVHSTCLHLWTAVMDSVRDWWNQDVGPDLVFRLNPESIPDLGERSDTDSESTESTQSDTSNEECGEWTWEVPDLSEGGAWNLERLANLDAAIGTDPGRNELWAEGLTILERHRSNYGEEGPQQLQLIWWEFPRESWEAIREGSSMNFLITPNGHLEPNSPMTEEECKVATKFVDELIRLRVLVPAEDLEGNCPLFCVAKPHEPGAYHCIADAKSGGQNLCMGKDPVYLVRAEDILPRLYTGGWSGVADASKHFHNFKTRKNDRKYLGCLHPNDGSKWMYRGLPMGTTNSPAIACWLGNSGVRKLRAGNPTFSGKVVENTWRSTLNGNTYLEGVGHGRVELKEDGEPVALIFSMVDDFLVHGPTKESTQRAFSEFMDHSVCLGFICQHIKTSPPAQQQKFCGMIYDTEKVPIHRIPGNKVSRGQGTVDYLIRANMQGRLSRLTVTVGGGFLQSLAEATPSRIGQTYLRRMYDEVHELEEKRGRELFYTMINLSPKCVDDLRWWKDFLDHNPGNPSRSGMAGTLVGTWGDGSGTGTGGTVETQGTLTLETWMGTWNPRVHHFSSNWKELRTLLWTMERLVAGGKNLRGATTVYFTDSMTSYYIVQNGSSKSIELHKLIRKIKTYEVLLGCRIEVIHVPGTLMIEEGTDGLSRGLWLSPHRIHRSSLCEAALALGPVSFSNDLGQWALDFVGLHPHSPFTLHSTSSVWNFESIYGQLSIWIPAPEVARLALVTFLEIWVEAATDTSGLFLIPRIMQRDWGHLSKHVFEMGTIYPTLLPPGAAYDSLIPFVVLYVPPHSRVLPVCRMDQRTPVGRDERWHVQQAEEVRGL